MTEKRALTEMDLQALANSWIRPEDAEAAGLFRVGNAEAVNYGFSRNGHSDLSGIVFVYQDPEDGRIRGYRLRRDNPELERKDGILKPRAKYLSPTGQPNFLYFAPDIRPEFLRQATLSIVIVEGEKKTLAVYRLAWHDLGEAAETPRFLVIGISGAWSWRGRRGKEVNANGKRVDVYDVIPDLDRITWEGRKVTLWPDTNYGTNANVRAGWNGLRAELLRRKAVVRFALLTETPDA